MTSNCYLNKTRLNYPQLGYIFFENTFLNKKQYFENFFLIAYFPFDVLKGSKFKKSTKRDYFLIKYHVI